MADLMFRTVTCWRDPGGGFAAPKLSPQLQPRMRRVAPARRRGCCLAEAKAQRDVAARALAQSKPFWAFLQNAPSSPGPLPLVLPESLVVAPGIVVPVARMDKPAVDLVEYLRRILTAKVYDVAVETPLELAPRLSERLGNGNAIYMKREDMQPVFSFKLRGAYNRIAQMLPGETAAGVVTASAGNHAQGVALSAKRLGMPAIICMPVTTPAIKVNSVRRLGAAVRLVGDTFDETNTYAKRLALDESRTFVPPFDDPSVIAGQGTVGMEILRQMASNKELHAIFVPVGGGGLIAGIAAYVKCVRPEIRVFGVEPCGANAMAISLQRGERCSLSKVDGFADGVAVKTVGEECFRVAQGTVDGVVLVDTDLICAAIKDVFEETRSILEPAGALALAGAKAYLQANNLKGLNVVAVTSGANMNFDRLRLVSELADVGQRMEAVLVTTIPEQPGAFKRFAAVVSGCALDITEFKYRYAGAGDAHVLYSVGYSQPSPQPQLPVLLERMATEGLATLDLTDSDVVKMHIRHLVGGAASVPHERLLKCEFPEKPGALLKFLDSISPRWNITLFHYRNAGGYDAKVLVGLQVPPTEEAEFEAALSQVGYQFKDVSSDPAFTVLGWGPLPAA